MEVFENLGFRVENLDSWGHKALSALSSPVALHFGSEILTAEGDVNRKALGERVFSSPQDLQTLEALVHPWMKAQIVHLLDTSTQDLWVLNAAILHKLKLEDLCDRIVWVTAPWIQRLIRIKNRGNIPWNGAFHRLWTQRHLSPKQFSQKVDILIKNKNGKLERSREILREKLREWVKQ